jgi:hypothetical protein
MSNRWVLLLVCAVLLGILVCAFIYPSGMLSPGPLSTAHSTLAPRCFSCHIAWRGATAEQCVSCHQLDDIGVRTTTGAPIVRKTFKALLHQALLKPDCLACHDAHRGNRPPLTGHKSFNHQLLQPAIQQRCADCHAAPVNKTHRDTKAQCAQCHRQDHWKPATFDHALLDSQALTACEGCHQGPDDKLHKQISKGCHQCHDPQGWARARFDHDQHFRLDKQHSTNCITCHTNNDYSRYTCYGCHEHTAKTLRAEHQEEGVRFSDDCVKCHKSADDDGENSETSEGRERDD